jgi:hypothetical protein
MQYKRSVEDVSMYNGIELNHNNSSQTQLNQSNNDIIINDNNSLKYKIYSLIDILLSCFIFTPLVIIFWASTWDILYLFIFPNDFYLSILTTLAIANSILIFFHLFQKQLNNFHLKIRDIIKMDSELDILNQTNAHVNYYSRDFYFRCFYSYVLTGAYVCAWKTYWDLYTHFTNGFHWIFFLMISFIAIIFYRFGLRRSLDNFTRTVPFYFFKDVHFEQTFLQPKRIFLKNVITINKKLN